MTVSNAIKLGRALWGTAGWISCLVAIFLLAKFKPFTIDYKIYVVLVSIGSLVLIFSALFSFFRAATYMSSEGADRINSVWYTDNLLVFLVLLWALFPPTYFLTEYYAFDADFITLPAEFEGEAGKEKYLTGLTVYSDLASKVWIGTSAVLGAIIAISRK